MYLQENIITDDDAIVENNCLATAKRLKILILSHSFYPDIGGIETNSEILANEFVAAGHEVHVMTWSMDNDHKIFSFSVIRNPPRWKLIAEHKWADIVMENNPCLRLSWPSLFFKKPLVVVLNTWIAKANGKIGVQEKLKFWWLKKASKVIAVSNALRLRSWSPAIVINNCYRENEFRKIDSMQRTNNFVFLGRLVSDKGADLAIRAIHQIFFSMKDCPSLTIIGGGPDRKKLELLTADLGLQNYVHFVGPLRGKELVKFLNYHSYMVVPSVWEEPFGNVALEGMACGCLPIVSDGGGLPDAIGDAGLTFKRGDLDSLVKVIKNLLSDPDLEKKLRNAAMEHLAKHEAKYISAKYLEVIEAIA